MSERKPCPSLALLPPPPSDDSSDDDDACADDAVDLRADSPPPEPVRSPPPSKGTPQGNIQFLLQGGGATFEMVMVMPFHEVLQALGLPLAPKGKLKKELPLKPCAAMFARLIARDLPLSDANDAAAGTLTENAIAGMLLKRASELFFLFGEQETTPDDLMADYARAYQKAPYVTKRCAAMLVHLAPYMFQVQYNSAIVFQYIAGREWTTGLAAQQDCSNVLASLVLYLVLAYSGNNAAFSASQADIYLKQALEAPEVLIENVLAAMLEKGPLPVGEHLLHFYSQTRLMPEKMGVLVIQLIFAFGATLLSSPGSHEWNKRRIALRVPSVSGYDNMFLVSGLLHFCQHAASGVPLSVFLKQKDSSTPKKFLDAVVFCKVKK